MCAVWTGISLFILEEKLQNTADKDFLIKILQQSYPDNIRVYARHHSRTVPPVLPIQVDDEIGEKDANWDADEPDKSEQSVAAREKQILKQAMKDVD